MGDTGSLVVGLILSILAIRLIDKGIDLSGFPNSTDRGPIITIAILSVSLYDTFRIFFIRIFSGYNPLHADRNHIHHALLDLDLGHVKSTIILYFFNRILCFLLFRS